MTKLIAIHALHLASAVAGKVDVINPGESFVATEDELYLAEEGRGAARKATSDDKHATEAVRAGKARATLGVAGPGPDAPKVELSKMNKTDLTALATAEEIDISEAKTNAEIVTAIETARAAKQDDLV